MRQLEEEKEMLEQGMEVVESARLWYQKQLSSINDKQKFAAWSSFNVSPLSFITFLTFLFVVYYLKLLLFASLNCYVDRKLFTSRTEITIPSFYIVNVFSFYFAPQ